MKTIADLHTLASTLGERLLQRQDRVSTAESCTGGMIAAALTDIAGSSAWFERGYVTYSNTAKITDIDVPSDLIDTHGAVSEAVAAAMASGALQKSLAQYAIAVTGVAGPSGGTTDKPVGMVCFGWARADGCTETRTLHFAGDRAAVRLQSACHALTGLLAWLDQPEAESDAPAAPA